jgi:hypothetical protein
MIIDTKTKTAVIGGELVTLVQLEDIVKILSQGSLDKVETDLSKIAVRVVETRSDVDWSKFYKVTTYADGHMECSCMDFQTRRKAQGTECKHIQRVRWAR